MARRVFTNCLNLEPKAFNSSIGSLIGGAVMLVLFGASKGLMWGIGGGAVGFMIGGWLSRQWYMGQIHRKLYCYLPGHKVYIDKNMPASYHRKLM